MDCLIAADAMAYIRKWLKFTRMRKDSAARGKRQRVLTAMKQFLIAPLFRISRCDPTPVGMLCDFAIKRS